MKSLQEQTLGPLVDERGWRMHCHSSLEEIPRDVETFTMLVAHEFFDALPFHLLQVDALIAECDQRRMLTTLLRKPTMDGRKF